MNSRTRALYKSIRLSALTKVFSILISFLLTPIIYNSLSESSYGIWATLLPIFTWFTFFDFGIGNGLRNKITFCISTDDLDLARKYIANAILTCSIFSILFIIILFILLYFEEGLECLNIKSFNEDIISSIILICIAASIGFVLGLINNLYHAVQESHFVTFGQFLNSMTTLLLFIPIYYGYYENSIYLTSIIYSISLILSLVLLSIMFFKKYPSLMPRLNDINVSSKYFLLKVGLGFFILQLASLVIFSTDKLVITSFVGPEETASYDIVYKYFSIMIFVQSIITTPLWSATTDAVTKNDLTWIRAIINKQVMMFYILMLSLILMAYFSEPIFKLWIGDSFKFDGFLVSTMVVFIGIMSWNNIFSTILNGASIMKFQIKMAVLAMFTNIPISIVLIKFLDGGASSVLIGSSISLSFFAIFSPFVVKRKILENNSCY